MSALTATQSSSEVMRRQMRARRTADQAGRIILVGVLLITAAVYLVMPVVSAIWMANTPFMGVFLEYPNSVSRDVTNPFLPNMQAGFSTELRQEDQIIQIDGHAAASADDIYRALRSHQIGDRVDMIVVNAAGETRETYAFLERFPLSPAFGLFVLPYIVGLLYIAIGMWVY